MRVRWGIVGALAAFACWPHFAHADEDSDAKRLVFAAGGGLDKNGAMGIVTLGYGWGTETLVEVIDDGNYNPNWFGHTEDYWTRRVQFIGLSGQLSGEDARVIASYGRASSNGTSHRIMHLGVDIRVDPETFVGVNGTVYYSFGIGVFVSGTVYAYPSLNGNLAFGVIVSGI